MSISVGVAPGTWGISAADAPGQPSWQVFLDEAAEAGYAGIEAGPYGYLPTEPAILRSELESRGLRIIATTVMHGHLDDPEDWPVIEAEALRVGELGAAMGSRHLVLIDDFYTDAPSGLARIHRRTSLGTALEEAGWCPSESGIMVLEQKPARKQGAPNRCCHRTNPTVSASSLTTIAWWPMPACSCRPP